MVQHTLFHQQYTIKKKKLCEWGDCHIIESLQATSQVAHVLISFTWCTLLEPSTKYLQIKTTYKSLGMQLGHRNLASALLSCFHV